MKLSTLSGLGDAVYAFPFVAHFAALGPVELFTKYPDVFANLPGVQYSDTRGGVVLGYSRGPGANFYEDIAKASGVRPDFVFRPKASGVVSALPFREPPRPICLVKEPSTTDMHKQTRDFSMSPNVETMQTFIDTHKKDFYFVSVCHPGDVYRERLKNIDLYVSGLSVPDFLSLCSVASAFASQIGHFVPIAQGLSKKLFLFPPERNTARNTRHVTPAAVIVPGREQFVEVIA